MSTEEIKIITSEEAQTRLPDDLSGHSNPPPDNSVRRLVRNNVGETLRPFRQGSFDTCCGLYAIVNAFLRIRPQIFADTEICEAMFRVMTRRAAFLSGYEAMFSEGLDGFEFDEVAASAIRFLARRGHKFRMSSPDRLFRDMRCRQARRAEWLARASLIADISVLVYVEKSDFSHWSVLHRVRGDSVMLFDSDAMTSAGVRHCIPWKVVGLTSASDRSRARPGEAHER